MVDKKEKKGLISIVTKKICHIPSFISRPPFTSVSPSTPLAVAFSWLLCTLHAHVHAAFYVFSSAGPCGVIEGEGRLESIVGYAMRVAPVGHKCVFLTLCE